MEGVSETFAEYVATKLLHDLGWDGECCKYGVCLVCAYKDTMHYILMSILRALQENL
jgi:hypothetical protein